MGGGRSTPSEHPIGAPRQCSLSRGAAPLLPSIYVLTAGGPSARYLFIGTWMVSDSPIRSDSTYYGETYDAREEQPGWATPQFVPPAGGRWVPASTNFTVVAQLNAQGMPPVKPVKELLAVSMTAVPVPAGPGQCAVAGEEANATVACPGSTIKAVTLATFGVVDGACNASSGGGGPSKGRCSTAANFTRFVSSLCVGQESCSVRCIGRVPPPYPNGECFGFSSGGGAGGGPTGQSKEGNPSYRESARGH